MARVKPILQQRTRFKKRPDAIKQITSAGAKANYFDALSNTADKIVDTIGDVKRALASERDTRFRKVYQQGVQKRWNELPLKEKLKKGAFKKLLDNIDSSFYKKEYGLDLDNIKDLRNDLLENNKILTPDEIIRNDVEHISKNGTDNKKGLSDYYKEKGIDVKKYLSPNEYEEFDKETNFKNLENRIIKQSYDPEADRDAVAELRAPINKALKDKQITHEHSDKLNKRISAFVLARLAKENAVRKRSEEIMGDKAFSDAINDRRHSLYSTKVITGTQGKLAWDLYSKAVQETSSEINRNVQEGRVSFTDALRIYDQQTSPIKNDEIKRFGRSRLEKRVHRIYSDFMKDHSVPQDGDDAKIYYPTSTYANDVAGIAYKHVSTNSEVGSRLDDKTKGVLLRENAPHFSHIDLNYAAPLAKELGITPNTFFQGVLGDERSIQYIKDVVRTSQEKFKDDKYRDAVDSFYALLPGLTGEKKEVKSLEKEGFWEGVKKFFIKHIRGESGDEKKDSKAK